MAFDAGMLACSLHEIRTQAMGGRIEKIYQPEKDEIILQMRTQDGSKRLLINASSSNSRIGFTSLQKENPQNPPMFCMFLRKHLTGARLLSVTQADFDRIAFLEFETRDEMGYLCRRFLIAELMGRYSNLIFTDGEKKIVNALKTADFSLDSQRGLLAGAVYSLPSLSGKVSPLMTDKAGFDAMLSAAPGELPADKFIMRTFCGISSAVSREIAFRACKKSDSPIADCGAERLKDAFFEIMDAIRSGSFSPCIVYDGDRPAEYSFIELTHYVSCRMRTYSTGGEVLDAYFDARDKELRVRQRGADLLKILNSAVTRLQKKIELQSAELEDCKNGETYKKYADLITANIYRLSRGDTSVTLDDYESMDDEGNCERIVISLDSRLTPAANAQRYYKRYNKSKRAKEELTRQLSIAHAELEYLAGVSDALVRAETPTDLAEIRDELYVSGYASRMKGYSEKQKKTQHAPEYMQYVTDDGMSVLCGKNNIQNDYITHKIAKKGDYWFHVKSLAGSHVILQSDGKEPTDRDFTQAAEIAALNSSAEGQNIAVDYTLAKNVKKPAGAKAGYVIYHTNYTAYVSPDKEKIASLRKR